MAVTPFELTEPFSTDTFNSRINEINIEIIPTGTVFWLASETIPEGFLVCDGASVSRVHYASLFSVIGTAFGSNDDTTFKLPDLRAKFIRGAGTSGNYSATFGSTQEASSLVSNGNDWPTVNNAEFDTTSGNEGYTFGAGSGSYRTHTYWLRPYNIALTPVIKYM